MAKSASPFARRVLFGCWLLVLIALAASPQLRQLALLQSQGSMSLGASNIATPSVARLAIVPLPQPESMDALEWMRRHPELPIAHVDAAYETESSRGMSPSSAMRQGFDAPIGRFANGTWLYAARLRYTFGEFPGLGQTMIDPENSTGASTSAKVPPPVELARSLEVARRGSELEPDNAFFDICAALLHIQAGHADLAVRSLQAAGRKKGFNEHVGEESWARIENGRLKGPRTFESEMAISASMPLPQYAVMREGARRFVARGRDLEARGKHKEALEIYGALMSMGRSMNQGETLITSLVGRAIGAIAITRGRPAPVIKNPPMADSSRRASLTRQLRLQAFVAYANAHGRADLARAAEEDVRVDAALRRAGSNYLSQNPFGSIPSDLMGSTSALWRIGAALLVQVALGIIVLIPLSTWRGRMAREERCQVSRLDVASAVLPPLFAVAACAWMVWHRRATDWTMVWGDSPNAAVPASTLLSWAVALAPLPFIAVWCAVGSAWSRRGRARAQAHDVAHPEGDVSPSPAHDSYRERSEVLARRVGSLVLGLGWLMVAGLGAAWLMVPSPPYDDQTHQLLSWLLPSELLCVLALHAFLHRQATAHDDASDVHTSRVVLAAPPTSNALERARRALCWTTALAAVSWIALAATSLPLRAQAQANLDAYVKNGEMSPIRQQAGLKP